MLTLASSASELLASTLNYPLLSVTTLAMTLGIYQIAWPKNVNVENCSCYDYIVIGSGSGAVVANRLSEDQDVTVLMIEAGKEPSVESILPGLFFLLQNSYQDFSMKSEKEPATVSQSEDVFKIAAGKTLGGSSTIHHLIHLRGSPSDYDNWAEIVGDDSWSYDNVLPYFMKSETVDDAEVMASETAKFHNTTGPMVLTIERHDSAQNYLEAFKEVGQRVQLDLNGNDTVGYTQPLLTIGKNFRQSTAQAYASPAADYSNLIVTYESVAVKIIIDENKTARSVNYIKNGKTYTVHAKKEIIVSAGVFKTPQLLMLSGIGPAEHLTSFNIPVVSDVPVGQNLQDHVGVLLVTNMETLAVVSTVEELPKLTSIPIPVIIGAARINQSLTYPEYQTTHLITAVGTPYLVIACTLIFGYKNDICEELNRKRELRNALFTLVAKIDPKSRGSVTLNSTDPLVQPEIRMNFYKEESDLDDMVDYIENFLKVHNSTYFQSVDSKTINLTFDDCEGDFSSREYIRCYAERMTTTLYHQVGTCAMGTVVDSELKVLGVERLRVVDASVMAVTPRANPLASTVMIAEKASDMIKAARMTEYSMCTPPEKTTKSKFFGFFGL